MNDDDLLSGRADAIPSLAMEPHERTINGHQAVCFADDESHWQGDERIPYITGGHMTWLGEWRSTYIHAKFDAIEHNHTHHPSPQPRPAWDQILRGEQ